MENLKMSQHLLANTKSQHSSCQGNRKLLEFDHDPAYSKTSIETLIT